MAAHAIATPPAEDRIQLGSKAENLYRAIGVAAVIGLIVGILLMFLPGGSLRRFYFTYLASLGYVMSMALGALAFVLLQHLTRAGWSVSVRRIAENMAATLPVLAAASLPILVSVVVQDGDLYRWALHRSAATPEALKAARTGDVPEEAEVEATENAPKTDVKGGHRGAKNAGGGEGEDEIRRLDPVTYLKRAWLNPFFFIFRLVACFAIWSAIAIYFWRQSMLQDQTGDVAITERLQKYSGALTVVLGVTVSIAAFDLFMSLDPHWYSTMFEVYFIAGCLVSSFAAMIVSVYVLQKKGYLLRSFSTEHFHDLGKYLFAFTFFWGYIAFSQFMLLWYANLPETVTWFSRRGATTAKVVAGAIGHPESGKTWRGVAVTLLFGMLLIPFAGLMSRHIKRRPQVLVFWACWILVFHFVDLYWVVMPEFGPFRPHLMDLAVLIGLGSLFVAAFIRNLSKGALRPTADPRLDEALVFQNL